MISIQEALNIILENIPSPEFEEVQLIDALGKKVAEDIYAPFPSPRFNNSAKNGYAVKWEDCQKNKPLKVIGKSYAGISFDGEVKGGEAVAVSSGAKIPEGTDTVIPIEGIEKSINEIRVKKAGKKSQYIKFTGEEYKANKLLIPKDTDLSSAQLALLASMGKLKIKVYKSPAVSIIATGSELNTAYGELDENKIFDSNSTMLASAVKECSGNMVFSTVVEDDPSSITEILGRTEEISDIILFTGGVSIGEHDFVRNAARECGFKELFWGVKQKPGKPLFFAVKSGNRRSILLFGLPGNPVSAYICFFHYAAHAISRLNYSELLHKKIYVPSSQRITNNKERTHMLRVKLVNEDNSLKFKVLDKQDSYMITSISEADGYVIVEENQVINKDTLAEIFLFPARW